MYYLPHVNDDHVKVTRAHIYIHIGTHAYEYSTKYTNMRKTGDKKNCNKQRICKDDKNIIRF